MKLNKERKKMQIKRVIRRKKLGWVQHIWSQKLSKGKKFMERSGA